MNVLRPLHTLRKPGLAWLLWLAALLPLAQTAALAHAASHGLASQAAGDDDKALAHAAHCDLCLAAAALGGAAPAPVLETPLLPAPAVPPQAATATAPVTTPAAWAWQSRAPPASPR